MKYHHASIAAVLGLSAAAHAQSVAPAAFVANNGNLRGSVTSFIIQPDASLTRVQELVLASIPSGSDPGTNAYAISITPSGDYLAISHATSAGVTERISLVRVNADATLTLANNLTTPDSPLDLQWVSDTLLAVTRTRTSGTNDIILYRFNRETLTITEVDRDPSGTFTSKLALSPNGQFLICNNSPLAGGASLRSFRVDAALESLTETGQQFPGTGYALGQCFSPDGQFIYSGSGSSSTQGYIGALSIDTTGVMYPLPGSPFLDAGSSPKQCVASPGGSYLYVGHGTDSTIRLHSIDNESGALTDLAMVYDVGIQGSLGDMATMNLVYGDTIQELLLFTDKETYDSTPRGLFSALINPDGSITLVSIRIDTLGVAPNDIATWRGSMGGFPCNPDVNCDGSVNGFDIEATEQAVNGDFSNFCESDADLNGDGAVNGFDIETEEQRVNGGPCP
ncbi:hypothetical protein PHYC_02639 [Phycisphaerales bacterium]|nr:hypothetical protein PHYC_02639 [Phycisphaerales bacterium]